jgi:hypothetical protein
MAFFGAHIALPAQARHDATDDHGVGVHGPRQHLGGDRLPVLGHVQEDVKNAGKSAVSFHVTLYVT